MKNFLRWFLAFIITAFVLFYQRVTGPTYPMRGNSDLGNTQISYKLLRTHETTGDCEIRITVPDREVQGILQYKRFKTRDPLTRLPMIREGENLAQHLPKQPSAGKLEYKVLLTKGAREVSLSGETPIVIRFKDPVPTLVIIVHIIVIFAALLFSTRTGLEALRPKGNPRKLVLWTVALLFLGGMIFGPIMQKYAFGAFWTGFPFGTDLTDNKTLIALIGWVAAVIAGRGGKPARGWVLAAAVLLLIVFLIPHSLLGSELDYTTLDEVNSGLAALVPAPVQPASVKGGAKPFLFLSGIDPAWRSAGRAMLIISV